MFGGSGESPASAAEERFEVVFVVSLPDEGTFDWLEEFLDERAPCKDLSMTASEGVSSLYLLWARFETGREYFRTKICTIYWTVPRNQVRRPVLQSSNGID